MLSTIIITVSICFLLKNSGKSLPGVRERAIRAVLLNVHAEETHVHSVNLLKGEKCFGSVGEALAHLSCVYKPETKQGMKPPLTFQRTNINTPL